MCGAALFVTPLTAISAQNGASRSAYELQVRVAEAARFRAMIRRDLHALDTLLASDLTYTHTSGERQSKSEFETMLRSGELTYLGAQPESVVVRIYGNTAVADGRSKMHVRSAGGEATFTIRFLEAYVRRRGRWELVAWQSTILPQRR
jgi:Domain of unknown function (DUF4440)